jgi:hypothetical protein
MILKKSKNNKEPQSNRDTFHQVGEAIEKWPHSEEATETVSSNLVQFLIHAFPNCSEPHLPPGLMYPGIRPCKRRKVGI